MKNKQWITKEQYEKMKAEAEKRGLKFISKYRKNMQSIKLADIVLGYDKPECH